MEPPSGSLWGGEGETGGETSGSFTAVRPPLGSVYEVGLLQASGQVSATSLLLHESGAFSSSKEQMRASEL